MIDMGTNTSDIEVRPQRDGTRVMTSDDSTQASFPLVNIILPTGMSEQMPMPLINLSISGYEPESLRDSHIRTDHRGIQENSTISQLDGPVSIPTRDRRRLPEDIRIMEGEYSKKKAHIFKGPLCHKEGNIWERVVMILIMIGDHIEIKDPLKEEDIKVRMEGHQVEEDTRIEDTLGEGTPIKMEDPLEEEVHLMEMENPLMMEDP